MEVSGTNQTGPDGWCTEHAPPPFYLKTSSSLASSLPRGIRKRKAKCRDSIRPMGFEERFVHLFGEAC